MVDVITLICFGALMWLGGYCIGYVRGSDEIAGLVSRYASSAGGFDDIR